MNCETCKKGTEPVPYVVHESAMARQERTIRRLWILVLVTVFLLVGTNGLWVYYESQFVETYTSMDIEQETNDGGDNYIVGRDLYGKAESQDYEENQDP